MVKIKNKFIPSDMMRKHLAKMEMQQTMENIAHRYEEGCPAAAPTLAKNTDTNDAMSPDQGVGSSQESHIQRGSNENCTSNVAAIKNCTSRVAAIKNCTSTQCSGHDEEYRECHCAE